MTVTLDLALNRLARALTDRDKQVFVCELCGEGFQSDRSKADAVAEAKSLFPALSDAELASGLIACDGCYAVWASLS